MKRIYIMQDDPIAFAMERDGYKRRGYEVRECDGQIFAREMGIPYRIYAMEITPADTMSDDRVSDDHGSRTYGSDILCFGELMIDRRTHSVYLSGRRIMMRVKEFDLLLYLAEHPNEVIEKERLYREVWNEEMVGSDATITEHIRRIRSKIEMAGKPRHIETIRRKGYRFCA